MMGLLPKASSARRYHDSAESWLLAKVWIALPICVAAWMLTWWLMRAAGVPVFTGDFAMAPLIVFLLCLWPAIKGICRFVWLVVLLIDPSRLPPVQVPFIQRKERAMQKADAEEKRVAWWSRLLALLFVATAAFILASTAAASWEKTHSLSELWPRTFADFHGFMLFVYFVFLFAFVAFTGRAPVRFLPGCGQHLNRRTLQRWVEEAHERAGQDPSLPPPQHPAHSAALRLRQPVMPWWTFWLFLFLVIPLSGRLPRWIDATQTPFWDFFGPFGVSMTFLFLFSLYFIIQRLEDLTTVWHSRWPGKRCK